MAAPTTPTTSRSTNQNSSLSTPMIDTSSSLSQFSSQAQHELKRKMRMEYFGQVYGSNRLLSNVFRSPISPNKVELVTEDCIKKFKSLSPFPKPTVKDERKHYKPFVDRLNAVKASLMRHDCMKDSIYLRVEFEVYNRLMAEGVGNDAAQMPDALARIPSGIADDRVFWEDVELCVEVKNKYWEMVAQGATYARSISYAQRGRRFVLMTFFEQKKCQASFGLFSPGWLCLSKTRHDLRSESGQRGFIRDMAQIWSCTDRWSAGFEDTCNNVQCFLEDFGTFSYRENICYRTSLRGRRTRVDLIDDGEIWTNQLPLQNSYILRQIQGQNEYYVPEKSFQSEESRPIRFSARLAANRLAEQITVSKGRAENSPSELPVPNKAPFRYRRLILKDSWPLVSRENREAEVFRSYEDEDESEETGESSNDDGNENEDEKHQEFGVSIILRSFSVTNSRGELSDTASTFPPDGGSLPRAWEDDGSEQSKLQPQPQPQSVELNEPEQRVHVRLLISTEGVSLENAGGPRQLVQAVLHAMIGYSVIFRRRWLHRDISIGNVLLMRTPKKRRKIKGFEDILTKDILGKHFSKCTGFISDGDLAVNWDKPDRERAKQRSGTPPFMSCELLGLMNKEAFHSAIDDLESFAWVLFWAILSVMERCEVEFTEIEQEYRLHLRSRNPNVLLTKHTFPAKLLRQQFALVEQEEQKSRGQPVLVEDTPSPAFAPFVGILREWLMLAFSDEILLSKLRLKRASVAEHERIVQSWIGKYLSIGIKHLDTFPDTWDYIL